ncbi:uncharacterized protein LOC134278217 [Saccostrea cucullata]|uniref:uncharacterized protein LOC134278217 n=1 Tax=Saccostrea cuccullata TaxID=36930 RepID=UPI002ED417C9
MEESSQAGQIRDDTFDDSFRSVPVLESTREAEGSRNDELMVSFNISRRAVVESPQVLEESIEDGNPVDDTVLEDVPVTFKVLEKGSSRGGRLLVSSDGYSYCVKREGQKTTTWTCSMRSKKLKCYASVSQQGELFVKGSSKHLHPGNLKLPHLKEISAKVKQSARENVFQSAMSIAEGTVTDHFNEETRFLAPNLHLIKRVANRFRSKFRPEEPVNLNFQVY